MLAANCRVTIFGNAYANREKLKEFFCYGCRNPFSDHVYVAKSDIAPGTFYAVLTMVDPTQARRGERGMTDSPAYGPQRSAVGT